MAGIKTYIEESYNELVHKVTWPKWNELQESSVLVLVASIMIALVVFAMDFVFGVNNAEWSWEGILGILYRHVLVS
ncbi:MAG: preprotein translocase subunit SecE [Flavobacteriales bacterium]|nr:preprotein translocase subunit SecE [Flavobacteriales bacterium]